MLDGFGSVRSTDRSGRMTTRDDPEPALPSSTSCNTIASATDSGGLRREAEGCATGRGRGDAEVVARGRGLNGGGDVLGHFFERFGALFVDLGDLA
jgi:hypothetical protein